MQLEVCVDTPAGLEQAVLGGADRIELCAALELGGLTPSPGFMRMAAGCGVPVFAMIRPRSGDFVFAAAEVAQMRADIAAARAAGLAGVVLGASLPDGRLDAPRLADLCHAAGGLGLTLHRAFDMVPDADEAVETAVTLGFHRILTAGLARNVTEGAPTLARIVARAAGRLSVMPGSGVTSAAAPMLARLGVTEVHASCAAPLPQPPRAVAMGFAPPERRQTRADLVAALKAAFALPLPPTAPLGAAH